MSKGSDDDVDEDCDSEDCGRHTTPLSVLCPAPATTTTATTTASATNDPTIHATVSFSPVSLPLPLPLPLPPPPPRAAPSPVPPPEWPWHPYPFFGLLFILLAILVFSLAIVSIINWSQVGEVIVVEATAPITAVYNTSNTAWYPRIAVAAENDFISKYLEVNFSVVTIFNATRDNRISQFCAHGEECHIPNSALTFICPPPDCGAMAGIPGTEYYMFTRAELVWKPNVTVEPTEVYSTRFFYAITTTECVYPSDFRQYCEPKPIQLLEWISITDLNIVPILDNFLMPSHVEDSNRVWPEFLQIAGLGYPSIKDIWHVEDIRDHFELRNSSLTHRNSILSVNTALTPYLTQVYRQHSHLINLMLEIGAALGLLKATAIITWLNHKLWQNRGDWKPQEFVTNWARTWSGDVSSSLKKFNLKPANGGKRSCKKRRGGKPWKWEVGPVM